MVLDVILSGELPAFLDILRPSVDYILVWDLAEETTLVADWSRLDLIFVSFYSLDNSHFLVVVLVFSVLIFIDLNIGESLIVDVIRLVAKWLHLDRVLRI